MVCAPGAAMRNAACCISTARTHPASWAPRAGLDCMRATAAARKLAASVAESRCTVLRMTLGSLTSTTRSSSALSPLHQDHTFEECKRAALIQARALQLLLYGNEHGQC